MTSLLSPLAGLVIVACLVLLAVRPINRLAWQAERVLTLLSATLIMIAMVFVSAEVLSRHFFNWPIPGHLELAELLLPPIIFLAIAYTQSTGGHVRMTIFVDWLSPRARHWMEISTKALSLGIYTVLCYYSALYAWSAWSITDVTMSPPYFVIWPSAVIVPIGIFFAALRLYLELLHVIAPGLLPEGEPGLGGVRD